MDVFGFFKNKQPKSGNVARDRLKLVLIHDRANYSPELLEMLKADLIRVISKYMEIDGRDIDIHISPDGNASSELSLSANVPIKSVRNKQQEQL